ncbi:nuclear transport factor 2 family protein [Nocardioides sp. 616]|uniref:nuclear transport factor 2 family protein n=1 Tax=Nocardioides sp. 616 TaxID=2268090 RepID=UPI000CE49CE9|nr:nuclear transport factor 2 family protein [Nocardioides sp. 616]
MPPSTEDRLRRIEDKLEIADLVNLYGFVMDERDLDGLPSLFTADAHLTSADGVFDAVGLETIAKTYQGRYDALGATNHFVHSVISRFDDGDPDVAHGLVSGHAELVREGVTMWVALRYHDVYRRTQQGWRIAAREMGYMYYLPVTDYAETMKSEDRTLVYGDPRPADWPSVLHGGDLGWLRAHYTDPA